MAEPLIPYIKLPEIPIPVVGAKLQEWLGLASEPSVKPFGVLVAIGVYAGTSLAMRRARQRGMEAKPMSDYLLWMLVTAFVLSHVLDALFYHPELVWRDPLYLLRIWDGLSSYGGFIGAVVGSFIWKWYYRRKSALEHIDVAVSVMPLAWVFGRAGCSVVHDHPGMVSSAWFAVRFPVRPLPADFWGLYSQEPYVGRFDLGLYECVLTIPLAIAVHILWRRRPQRPPGYYIGVICTLYPPIRFLLDFLRLPSASHVAGGDPRYAGLTPAQWACFALFAVGLYFLRRAVLAEAREAAATPPSEGADAMAVRADGVSGAADGRGQPS